MAKYTPASDQMRDRFFQVGEIVEKVLVHLDPVDVAAVAQTCWAMHELILPSNNPTLWRRLYDRMFDPIDSCRRLGFDWRKAIPLCNVPSLQSSHLSARKLAKSRATSRQAAPAWIVQRDANSAAQIGAYDDCDVNYATLVQSRCRARGVLHSPHEEKKARWRYDVVDTLHTLLMTASDCAESKNAQFLSSLLSNKSICAEWLDPAQFGQGDSPISTSPDFNFVLASRPPKETSKWRTRMDFTGAHQAAHLHVAGLDAAELRHQTYKDGAAHRGEIYRASNFNEANDWGPFLKRSDPNEALRPDWVMIDRIAYCMALNVKSAWHQWGNEDEMNILPYGYKNAVMWKQPGPGRDWAGIEGIWHYIYAFLDYSDFFAYNYATPHAVQNLANIIGAALPDDLTDDVSSLADTTAAVSMDGTETELSDALDDESASDVEDTVAVPVNDGTPLAQAPELLGIEDDSEQDEEEDDDFEPSEQASSDDDDEEDDEHAAIAAHLRHRQPLHSLADVTEAIGGINTARMVLIPPTPAELEAEEGVAYPPLRFKGDSVGPNGSTFTGKVEMLPCGNRSYTFVVRYSGADRWSSRGIEVGSRGIYCIWSDVHREAHSPCGAIYYFRA